MIKTILHTYFYPRFNWFDMCYFISVAVLCSTSWWWLTMILPLVIFSTIMETVTKWIRFQRLKNF